MTNETPLMSHSDNSEPDIKLAGLSLWVVSRQFPECDDYWDGNWLNVLVRVEANRATVSASGPIIRIDELAAFHNELSILHRDLTGVAELHCIEPGLGLKVSCSHTGQVEVVIDVTPDHLTQSHQFQFSVDQSYLISILEDSANILSAYPQRGSPVTS
jgi:hypothetical protein